jgi:hypothetical protein
MSRRSGASGVWEIERFEVRSISTSRNEKSRYAKGRSEPLDHGDYGPLIW